MPSLTLLHIIVKAYAMSTRIDPADLSASMVSRGMVLGQLLACPAHEGGRHVSTSFGVEREPEYLPVQAFCIGRSLRFFTHNTDDDEFFPTRLGDPQ